MQLFSSLYSLVDQAPAWLTAATGVITAASAITALTPTPKDDRFLARIVTVLEIFALNIGHARRRRD